MKDSAQINSVRLDKWLWAARFFKTRSLAKTAIEQGKVWVDGARAKASRTIGVGALLRMQLGFDEKTVAVLALSEQRGPATVAQSLYAETEDSQAKREQQALLRQQNRLAHVAPDHRPTKKERRDLQRLRKHSDPTLMG
jgi:ribosome-associated heat shock protein Hsp15